MEDIVMISAALVGKKIVSIFVDCHRGGRRRLPIFAENPLSAPKLKRASSSNRLSNPCPDGGIKKRRGATIDVLHTSDWSSTLRGVLASSL